MRAVSLMGEVTPCTEVTGKVMMEILALLREQHSGRS